MPFTKSAILALSLCGAITGGFFVALGCSAQSGVDQTIFQDQGEMLQMNNAQARQLEGQEQSAEARAAKDYQRNEPYRLYAEKRIQELEKLKGAKANNDEQIAVLQKWLKDDAATRAQDQQTIRNLQRQVANLQQSQQQLMSNLGNDVNAMRQDAQNQEDNVKFNQMMQINHFNELQTEMGPANWAAPSPRGAYYNMQGIGFSGGRGLW